MPFFIRNCLLPLAYAYAACTPIKEGELSTRHTPLYSSEPTETTIQADAKRGTLAIDYIQIVIVEGDMVRCESLGLPPAPIPCRRNAIYYSVICGNTANLDEPSCIHRTTFDAGRLVTYKSKIVNSAGMSEAFTQPITFATGRTGEVQDLALPVWWHSLDPNESKIDLAFFPDANQPEFNSFRRYSARLTRNLLEPSFFNGSLLYSESRQHFNLWIGPAGASIENDNCAKKRWDSVKRIKNSMDGNVIVHQRQLERDCAGRGFGEGRAGSANINQPRTMVHESGHFLHDLDNEYCHKNEGAPRRPEPGRLCNNSWRTESDCRNFADKHGLNPDDCENKCQKKPRWRIMPPVGEKSIMAGGGTHARFSTASGLCVTDRFAKCADGNCYPEKQEP
jgi:hypothetical protein